MGSGQWARLPQSAIASGWVFYQNPFAYAQGNSAWHYINEVDTQWVVNMRTGGWSQLGAQAVLSYLGHWQSNDFNVGRIALSETHLYMMKTNGFVALNITNPALPFVQSEWGWGYTNLGVATDIVEQDGYVYLWKEGSYFLVYDWEGGSWSTVTNELYSLYAIDVNNPESPTNAGVATTEIEYTRRGNLAIESGRVYVAAADLGVFSITDPSSPQYLCTTGTGYHIDLCVESNKAYVVGDIPGYQEFDFTLPTEPIIGTALDMPSYNTWSISKRNQYLYMMAGAYGEGNIETVRESMIAPTRTSTVVLSKGVDLCVTANNYLVALVTPTNDVPGISIYGLGSPASPSFVSHGPLEGAKRVECNRDIIAVSAGTNGVYLYRLNN